MCIIYILDYILATIFHVVKFIRKEINTHRVLILACYAEYR